jgi:hypothetical protein
MKTDVKVPSKRNKQKNLEKKKYFLLASCQPLTEKAVSGAGPGSVPKCHGSTTMV